MLLCVHFLLCYSECVIYRVIGGYMVSIDEFSLILDDLASELPEEFYDELNLGISVSEDAKPHPQSQFGDLFIMGEYFRSQMGCGIVIYYGSFERIHRHLPKEELACEMRATLRHEFRHHLEGRAGERGLEKEDEKRLGDYLGKYFPGT